MSKSKLEKVLEHLLNNQEGQAKALLHQIFIEKARSIHEDLMTQEDGDDDFMGGSGSDQDDFMGSVKNRSSDLEHDGDEIDFEEVMSEESDDDVADGEGEDSFGGDDVDGEGEDSFGGDEGGEEATGGEMQGMEKGIDALSKALEDLQAQFDRLQGGDTDGDEDGEDGEDGDVDADADGDVMVQGDEENGMDTDTDDEEVDEDWMNETNWDDLDENVNLEVVTPNMNGEVGAGRYSSDLGRSAKSPLPSSQSDRFGAKPVQTGKGQNAQGFERPAQLPSATLKGTQGDNRRSKSTQGTSPVSKEGASGALLNKSVSGNNKSPLSRAPSK